MAHEKHFAKKRILARMKSRELDDAYEELVAVFVKSGSVSEALGQQICDALREKARNGMTGAIGRGVAIPHVKLDGVQKTAVVVACSSEGLDFRAGDGALVHVVFCVIGEPSAPAAHLELLRWIAGLARDQDFARFAVTCSTPADIYDLLVELDGEVDGAVDGG